MNASPTSSPPPPGPFALGPLLLHARRTHGKSQRYVAQQLCAVAGVDTVSRHEISRWEREERIPSHYWLVWLSVVLGVDEDQLHRATARTRSRRESARLAPGPSAWPWRVLSSGLIPSGQLPTPLTHTGNVDSAAARTG
jgi:transcriptional regulator with XRE-family HTH domain